MNFNLIIFIIGNENTMCSLYQLIYSYRDTKDSEIPEFTSQNAIDAVNKILEIRDKISSSNYNDKYIMTGKKILLIKIKQ